MRDAGLFQSIHKKFLGHASPDDFSSDDLLFPPDDHDDEDYDIPLFRTVSPLPHVRAMPGSSSPIEIGTSRHSSNSPRTQTSNLTSQLQQTQQQRNDSGLLGVNSTPDVKTRQESVGMLGTTPYGARQIPMSNSQRRESHANALSGSMMGGMSWGGISMGSFIRDE